MQKDGMSLRGKLTAMTMGTVVALAMLFGALLYSSKQQMQSERESKLRSLGELAVSSVAHFEKEAREGRMSIDEAKSAAAAALRTMRYDNNEYFWINDLSDRMVMHPIKPELNGQMLNELKDKNGKLLFVEFNKVVRANGQGFVDYYWPKPGATEGIRKISFVVGFKPWDWVIGTGVYVDDIDAAFQNKALELLLWGIAISGFVAGSLFLVSRNIIHTLGCDPAVASAVTRRIAGGDLATPINEASNARPDSLIANIGSMQDTLRAMISSITRNAEQVSGAADQLLQASEEVADKARQQSDAASSMAASVEEMAVSIDQVKENAREAHDISQESGKLSSDGTEVIHRAATEMREISNAVQSSSDIVEELGQRSDQITSIVNTIREIADQTNLLALNAAIEAARAGEQGRGFAVVADEVRKLAERTSHSTTEIGDMVAKIQTGTRSAVSSMEDGVGKVGRGVDLATQAAESINRIREGANRVTQVVNDISNSISEQSTSSNEIAHQLETIAQMSEDSARAVRHTAESARALHKLSAELHEAVARFRT